MTDLNKQIIKDAVLEAMEPLAVSIQKDFEKVNERFDGIDKRLDGVDKRLDGIESRIGGLEYRVGTLEEEWKNFREHASSLFEKLDDLIGLYRKQEMELAALAAQVDRLNKRVEELERSRN